MDNLTHSLFAITLARTPLGRAGRGTTAALLLASNAPDIDIVTAARAGTASYLQWHRGPTHGPLGVVLLGAITGVLVWFAARYIRDEGETPPASLGMLVAVSSLAVLFHILMDFPTSYGTRLLSPFDWHWYAVDVMPIIDIYLLVALGAGLLFGRVSPEARRANAAIVFAFMAANYGVRGFAHHRAVTLAPRLFGPTLPEPCDPRQASSLVDMWPRDLPRTSLTSGGRRCLVDIAAIPTFLSPFRWRIVAHVSNAYELHDVDVLEPRWLRPAEPSEVFWRTSLRIPNVWTPAVERAATTRSAQVFLGFSRFPAARPYSEPDGGATVRWTDVRFAGGLVRLDQPARAGFALTIRVSPDGAMHELLTR